MRSAELSGEGTVPPDRLVRRIVDCLTAAGLRPVIGGSALLVALGIADVAHDWDVTVEAEPGEVGLLLSGAGLRIRDRTSRRAPFAGGSLFRMTRGDEQVDLMINLLLRAGPAEFAVSSSSSGTWHGLPMGEPSTWLQVYELLGRPEQAAALRRWLADVE